VDCVVIEKLNHGQRDHLTYIDFCLQFYGQVSRTDKIFGEVMLKRRKDELELYKLIAKDAAFKTSMQQSLQSMMG